MRDPCGQIPLAAVSITTGGVASITDMRVYKSRGLPSVSGNGVWFTTAAEFSVRFKHEKRKSTFVDSEG